MKRKKRKQMGKPKTYSVKFNEGEWSTILIYLSQTKWHFEILKQLVGKKL